MTRCRRCVNGWVEDNEVYTETEDGLVWLPEWDTCQCCGGEYEDCKNCAREFPNSVEETQEEPISMIKEKLNRLLDGVQHEINEIKKDYGWD